MSKKLRYVEISRRNPITRIMIGSGNSCNPMPICGEVCIEIRRAGKDKCGSDCSTCWDTQTCCSPCSKPKPACDPHVANVCALEIDDDGYAVFEWPSYLFDFQEGWYEGVVSSGCSDCGIFPIRIGPRCNVIEVETEIFGPDSLCWVGCEDDCVDDICPTGSQNYGHSEQKTTYVPSYEV